MLPNFQRPNFHIRKYLLGADNAYKANLSFENFKTFIKAAIEENKRKIEGLYLIIDVDDGVFIRCTDADFCEWLDGLLDIEIEEWVLILLEDGEWNSITRKYKYPKNLYGNEGLAIWRTGFK